MGVWVFGSTCDQASSHTPNLPHTHTQSAAMRNLLKRYAEWLHLKYPGGTVETLPRVDEHFRTNVPGVYVVGDLAGVPLLKFSLDGGTKAVRHIASSGAVKTRLEARNPDPRLRGDRPATRNPQPDDGIVDVAILGAGAAGMAAARECRREGLSCTVLGGSRRFATIKDFQKGKPIYTYPQEMTPAGELTVSAPVKEALVDELEAQTEDLAVRRGEAERIEREKGGLAVVLEDGEHVRARHVVVAIGRSGNYRRLDVPGEDLDKVHHRLHDPTAHAGKEVLVVGGGDAAAEAAVALAEAGARVTLSYRRAEFFRPKPDNVEHVRRLADSAGNGAGHVRFVMESEVEAIRPDHVRLATEEGTEEIENDVVFALIGREAPLEFFRRSGIRLRNEWGDLPDSWREAFSTPAWLQDVNWRRVGAMLAFVLFMAAVYSLTSGGAVQRWAQGAGVFPYTLQDDVGLLAPDSVLQVTLVSATSPSFYYTLAYSALIVIFGWRRIRRRKTPYIRWQTLTLMAIQVVPLFLLPEILLPYLGANGLLPEGFLNALFPASEYATHGREYWRAYGFILAWPLLVYNVFTAEPLVWWLAICFVQTFVLIPGMIYFWGKGAYCGWICSCGALAETLGDEQRDKMPHGEGWNKFNLAGQVILALAFLLLFLRIIGWIWPGGWAAWGFSALMYGEVFGLAFNYSWVVDVVLAGMIGYGVYFWLSGRFWCRFLCPLAALMHVYTKFSRFRILAEKEKCISCNVCTSVCHQGIDVMHYAQQGLPMDDPQCVRCSACVQSCPTGVLSFGQVDRQTGQVISRDALEASLTRLVEEDRAEDERAEWTGRQRTAGSSAV